jgi:hypothetical protein
MVTGEIHCSVSELSMFLGVDRRSIAVLREVDPSM